MKIKTKKIIAREVIILFTIISLVAIVYGILKFSNYRKDIKAERLQK
jgi:uncharacterized membrane protein affecting hemolysin expression